MAKVIYEIYIKYTSGSSASFVICAPELAITDPEIVPRRALNKHMVASWAVKMRSRRRTPEI